MNKLYLKNTKTLTAEINTKIFAGDNLITKINVQLPDNIGGYPKKECEYNLRAIIPEGNLSYMINPSQPYFYITNDITEKAQTVKLMMIITHEGNVIGRTNTVDLIVNEPAEAPDPPLTPREEFDEVIAEQRAEIAEQAETISEQATAIEAKDGQISELNDEITEKDGQITELNTENTRLEALTDTQRETIQNMLDNPPQPKLYTPQVVTPSGIVQTVTPPANYDGLASVTVDRVTADVDSNIQPENIKKDIEILGVEGTYDPFPYTSVGGIYITEVNESGFPAVFLIKNLVKGFSDSNMFLRNWEQTIHIKKILFDNCPEIEYLPVSSPLLFNGATGLIEARLPHTLKRLSNYEFNGCRYLKIINIPSSLTSIGLYAVFGSCGSLEYVTIENGFNCNNLDLSYSTRYSQETILSWFNALADRTGQTAYTLTIGTTNLNKLTAEEKAIATNKNWNLA